MEAVAARRMEAVLTSALAHGGGLLERLDMACASGPELVVSERHIGVPQCGPEGLANARLGSGRESARERTARGRPRTRDSEAVANAVEDPPAR